MSTGGTAGYRQYHRGGTREAAKPEVGGDGHAPYQKPNYPGVEPGDSKTGMWNYKNESSTAVTHNGSYVYTALMPEPL